MTTTALIIRPKDAPFIRVLEVDGPNDPMPVHYTHGHYLPVMSFEEWCAQPEHLKAPVDRPSDQDFYSACRIARLINDQLYPSKQKTEILSRLELLFPSCTGELLPTVSNLKSA